MVGIRHVRMAVPCRLVSMQVAVRARGHHFMGVVMVPIVVCVRMLMQKGYMVMFMVM